MTMNSMIESTIMLLLLSDLALFSVSLLSTSIKIVAVQGFLLGIFALLAQWHALTPRIIVIAVFSAMVKGIVFPYLIKRAIKETGIKREIQPFVGFGLSMVAGIVLLGAALYTGSKIALNAVPLHPFAVPVSFLMLFTGLFLIIARKKALLQCLGYIVCENGIYMFGMAAVGEIPALIEFGVLLDAFVAVFVMGIIIYHISREFDHIDTDRLNTLKG